MLSENQFNHYIEYKHKLSDAAIEYIQSVRKSEPSRMVGVFARSNVCSWVTSEKMGKTISSESRTAEKSFILLSEYDDRVLEIWDQPQPIKIERVNKNGRRVGSSYTADFLVLTHSGPVVIEVKPSSSLEKLIEKEPDNWVKTLDGGCNYIPARDAFFRLGLEYKVFVVTTDMRYKVANLEMMMQSRKADIYKQDFMVNINNAFEESAYWKLSDLKERLSLDSYLPLVQNLDHGKIFGDLDKGLISSPEDFYVSPSEAILYQANSVNAKDKIYKDGECYPVSTLHFPGEYYAKEALERLRRIDSGENTRSIRRWKAMIKEGEENGMSPFQSLVSRRGRSGNKKQKIHDIVNDYLESYLYNEYPKSKGLSFYRAYIVYKEQASRKHKNYEPVSRPTFMARLYKMPPSIVAHGRRGRRGVNAVANPTDPIKRALKPQLPWQTVAIDHYKADIYLLAYKYGDKVYVERPWISAMIDICTGCVLAVTISFRDPSKISCAKVIRECVRNHKKLPSEIIVDRGSDFKSVFFSSLLSHYGITLSLRPAAHSRFGGEVEGLFGEFKKQWLSQRPGNLADYNEVRGVDGKMAPKNSAVLRAYDLYRELQAFIGWRDSKPKTIESESGMDRFNNGSKDFPFVGVDINYDNEFRIASSVESADYKVDLVRGFHINEMYYSTPNIEKLRGKKGRAEVRRDPENPHLIYALIDGDWEACYSSRISDFSSKSMASQFEKGLIGLDAVNIRRKLKDAADVEAVRIIRELNNTASKEGQDNFDEYDIGAEEIKVSVFNDVDLSTLPDLTVERW